MTTLAKVEANRLNGQLSTGPRTVEGKVIVSRNATTHGIFSNVPVIPGEDPAAWQEHRAGVVASLAPVGLLEVNLAERAALLLWRMQRLARYEAETTAAALEAAEVPALPPPPDPIPSPFPPPVQKTREEQLRDLRDELRTARRELAEVGPARDYFRVLPETTSDLAAPFATTETVLWAAFSRAETAEDLRTDPPTPDSRRFLKKLGVTTTDAPEVKWTAGLIRRGVEVYAALAGEEPDQFAEAVGHDLDEWAEGLARKVRRLEAEATAVARLLDGGAARRQAAKLIPSDGREERIAKYERHLHSLLTSTLHELERLQARRAGEVVPPPAVADVNVTIDPGPG